MGKRWFVVGTIILGAAALRAHPAIPPGPVARAADLPVTEGPPPGARLAVGFSAVDGTSTKVGFATVGLGSGAATVDVLGAVDHVRGSAIRGAVLGASTIAVVVQGEGPRGTSYSGELHRVDAGGARLLCRGVARAATPLFIKGHLLIARGVDGAEPTPAESATLGQRVDALRIDEIDPVTGAARTVWRGAGYQGFLATGAGAEAIVLHAGPAGTSLLALDPATGASRTLGVVSPFVRDVTFDAARGALVFASGEAERWVVQTLELSGGLPKTLFVSAHDHPMPFALAGGDVALASDGDHGLLRLVRGARVRSRLLSPAGDGSDAVTHALGRWLAVRHTPARPFRGSRAPALLAVDADTGQFVPIAVPAEEIATALGFEGGAP